MPTLSAQPRRRYQSICAVVTRADGTVENRGLISFYHHNWMVNLVGNLYVRINYRIGEWRRACLKRKS
jgi:hypothetical protein